MNLDFLKNPCQKNLQNIVSQVFDYNPSGTARALLVYDSDCPLSQLLAESYQAILPHAQVILFNENKKTEIQNSFAKLLPHDLVILVQSSSFRLDDFRIRVHLFKQGLKVIEHPHLGRVLDEEIETYIEALVYDRDYFYRVGHGIKQKLEKACQVELMSEQAHLVFAGPFEKAKLNIGDYRGLQNWGGQFPIGEVFTELCDLTSLNGFVKIFAFGDSEFKVAFCEDPLTLEVRQGRVVATTGAPAEFLQILKNITDHEGEVWIRELGFGLNRALTVTKRISQDVGTYERMCGVHLSLGAKHALYPKEGFHKKKVKYHVDVFAKTDLVLIDNEAVYKNGSYLI